MSDILKSFRGKKGKKKFEELPPESKSKVIEVAIIEKISPVMAKEVANSMIRGMELEREEIYKKFVENIDMLKVSSDSLAWETEVECLLSYIRKGHLDYMAKQARENKGDKNETD